MDGPERGCCRADNCITLKNLCKSKRKKRNQNKLMWVARYCDRAGACWETVYMKSGSREESKKVRDVMVSGKDGCLSLDMTITAMNTIMKERI